MVIQKMLDSLISKIPYVNSIVNKMSLTDYIIIGSIVLVAVIVIASVAKSKSNKMINYEV